MCKPGGIMAKYYKQASRATKTSGVKQKAENTQK